MNEIIDLIYSWFISLPKPVVSAIIVFFILRGLYIARLLIMRESGRDFWGKRQKDTFE
ncbi:TPA: hypothetical protein TX926_000582 [Streptococcus suis]|nr:hypothetical protein [Streptococcus suis]HEL2478160.1 hypothetical protein [Streptococcus suis]